MWLTIFDFEINKRIHMANLAATTLKLELASQCHASYQAKDPRAFESLCGLENSSDFVANWLKFRKLKPKIILVYVNQRSKTDLQATPPGTN
jgi:hypothetical protein